TTVRLSNLRSHLEIMKRNPLGYSKRTMAMLMPNILSTALFSWMARAGMGGVLFAKLYGLIPEDEEDRNICIPLMSFDDEDGQLKVVYISIPHDQSHVFWNTLTRRTIKWGMGQEEFDLAGTLDD